jgi:hypothetical protein
MIRETMPVLMLLMVLALIGLPQALASTGDLSPFNAKYNTSGTRLNTCDVCHTTGANLNQYGMDMSNQTGTTEQRLANIELLDSDGDGFSNIDEINNLTFPGDFADTPEVTPYPTIIPETDGFRLMIFLAVLLLIVAYQTRQMKERDLIKWHRNVGIVLAPLLVLQAISGVFLSADWLLGYHQRVGEAIREIPSLIWLWDKILVEIHYGLRIPGAIEHIVLGIGLVWVTVSGFMIFLNTRARKKRLKEGKDHP